MSTYTVHVHTHTQAKVATYHLAGGACEGFATAYCGMEFDSNFCENFAVPPGIDSQKYSLR